jgi:hypothetical protein
LYPFGYGLSYTQFNYNNIKVEQKGQNSFEVSFLLKNVGKQSGDEVVQLYLRDEIASVVQPIKQLKNFNRVHLAPNEEKSISFLLTADDLAIINNNFEKVVEPGLFTVMIGSSSKDIKLTTQIEVK